MNRLTQHARFACLTLLAALLLLVVGCTSDGKTAQQTGPAEPTRVACVGDSITFGYGIDDREHNSYPAQLQRMLGEAYTVKNFGVSAATLLKSGDKPYWTLDAFTDAQNFQPDIVIIKLGSNDTKPHNWKHKDQYAPDYIEMIQTFRDLDSKPEVWICLPAPVVGERWGISDKVVHEEVITLIAQVHDKTSAPIIDLYTPLKGKHELLPDQVHPNAEGASIIAKTVKDAIAK